MNSINTNIYQTIQNNVPKDLTSIPQWVAWSKTAGRNGKTAKIPINPKSGKPAKTNAPETWTSFDEALAYSRLHNLPGVGFVFSETDEFVGIDLDHCIDPDTGAMNDEAKEIVDRLNSYAEISPSGQGLHIFVRGGLPEGPRKNGKVEIYDSKRFFTVTGNVVEGAPSAVIERHAELLQLYDELFRSPSAKIQPAAKTDEIDELGIEPSH